LHETSTFGLSQTANGRPLSFFMTAGEVSGYIGAAALLDELPRRRGCLRPRRPSTEAFMVKQPLTFVPNCSRQEY
jgi:hypothetical protein